MGHFESIGGRIDLSRAAVQAAGLREAQVGALWALAAHATISDEPAQVVLPTGVGKTIVAVLAPYVLRARRVLVVVPGKLIRSQVAAAFGDVGAAAETVGIFPGRMSTPKVAVAKHRATRESWDAWADVDVVIGTPSVLSPASGSVEPVPRDLFDLVIFDEAHHLPTSTWTALLVATDARAVLLTATPFRNDGKRLPGEMVYTYPLSRAIDAGVFGGVTYRAVDEVPREQLDVTLAREAVTRLRSPEHVAAASRLLVRTDSVAHARDLRDVYAAVGVSLGVIVHDTSWKRAEGMRQEVERGALAGFVCVGALTEGFNFPSLKIGVYHRPHKTLGPTLQFIGRLSRVGEVAGELIAPRSAVTDETAVLYREDVGWRRLLPDLVDQLTSTTIGGTTTSYGYTADGQAATRGSDTLAWDGWSRLTRATTGGNSACYAYDPVGNLRTRTYKTAGSTCTTPTGTTRYLLGDLIETNGAGRSGSRGSRDRRCGCGLGLLVAMGR